MPQKQFANLRLRCPTLPAFSKNSRLTIVAVVISHSVKLADRKDSRSRKYSNCSSRPDRQRKRRWQRCKMRAKEDEHLMQDHAALGELLGQTIAALEVKDIERSYASLDLFWARLAMHIRAEHLHLFPAISDAVVETRNEDTPSPADVQSAIEELRHDHDFFMRELSQAVLTLRGLLANAGVAVVGTLEDIRK